jgi:hypothetical protein
LAKILRSEEGRSLSKAVRLFLADVLSGKVKLKRRKKLTFEHCLSRHWSEKAALQNVQLDMSYGRNKNKRTFLIRKYCKLWGTTPERVEDYAKRSKQRR